MNLGLNEDDGSAGAECADEVGRDVDVGRCSRRCGEVPRLGRDGKVLVHTHRDKRGALRVDLHYIPANSEKSVGWGPGGGCVVVVAVGQWSAVICVCRRACACAW